MTKFIGVVSGKGGVGKTTVVANLGAVLSSKFHKNTVVIDCNITTSHLGPYLGMNYCPVTLNDVLRGRADIRDAIYVHDSGMMVIPASLSIDNLIGVDITHLKKSVKELFGRSDFVFLDSAPGLVRENSAVLRASDELLFVSSPYTAVVMDVVRCRKDADESAAKHLGVVLNMVHGDRHEMKREEVEQMTGLPVLASIPFDKNVLKCLSLGTPVVTYEPRSPASREMTRLASHICGERRSSREKKGIVSRLLDLFR